jgi:hypothetical protein
LLGTFTVVLGTLAVAFRLGLASFCRQFDRVVFQKVSGLGVDGTGALVCVRGSLLGFSLLLVAFSWPVGAVLRDLLQSLPCGSGTVGC